MRKILKNIEIVHYVYVTKNDWFFCTICTTSKKIQKKLQKTLKPRWLLRFKTIKSSKNDKIIQQ